ncbi:hypothetical protein V6N12_050432 [Hibiscus sabdariffa]|uniref:Uncharacterized protein n=1 Tax=Hibiscus sabdariffa TaxID=183260 RepID=A0ABR2GCF5_9ROSI
MVGSKVAIVALLLDSDDGDVSNIDSILPVLSNDDVLWMGNLVDSLLDFEEAWLNQSAQASDFEVNGENDEEVLASHANQDRVRKRSLVSSS